MPMCLSRLRHSPAGAGFFGRCFHFCRALKGRSTGTLRPHPPGCASATLGARAKACKCWRRDGCRPFLREPVAAALGTPRRGLPSPLAFLSGFFKTGRYSDRTGGARRTAFSKQSLLQKTPQKGRWGQAAHPVAFRVRQLCQGETTRRRKGMDWKVPSPPQSAAKTPQAKERSSRPSVLLSAISLAVRSRRPGDGEEGKESALEKRLCSIRPLAWRCRWTTKDGSYGSFTKDWGFEIWAQPIVSFISGLATLRRTKWDTQMPGHLRPARDLA